MKSNIPVKDFTQIDLSHSFFHYTNKENLDTIILNGLEPRIGENSSYVERTAKVFFVEGEMGIITIMDVWLRWLTAKITTKKWKYWLGTVIYMRLPFCIKSFPNNMVKKSLASREKRSMAYTKLKRVLDNSVFLVLDLIEDVDFDYTDVDEVKKTYYESFLRLLYPSTSDLKDPTMEYWNLHTFSNKVIEPYKVYLLKENGTDNANIILIRLIEKYMDYVKCNCEFLYEYYLYVKNIDN